jgi:hypothetical protein
LKLPSIWSNEWFSNISTTTCLIGPVRFGSRNVAGEAISASDDILASAAFGALGFATAFFLTAASLGACFLVAFVLSMAFFFATAFFFGVTFFLVSAFDAFTFFVGFVADRFFDGASCAARFLTAFFFTAFFLAIGEFPCVWWCRRSLV